MKNRMCKTNCYKKCCAFLAALLMLAVLALPGMAAAPLIRDEMGLFDADTYNELEQSAEAASSGHDCDVYFLVVNDIGDANQRDFAKNYYVNNGLGSGEGKSGILFLLAVGSRKYVTITYGGGVTAFTDYRIEQMEDDIVPELSDGDWAGAAALTSRWQITRWTTMPSMASPLMWTTTWAPRASSLSLGSRWPLRQVSAWCSTTR